MLGLVTTLNGKAPVELRELPEPQPQRNEALVAVHAIFAQPRRTALGAQQWGRLGARARTSPVSC